MTPDQVPNSMTPAEYALWVKRSESPAVDATMVPPTALWQAATLMIAAAEAINQIKRAVVYPTCVFNPDDFARTMRDAEWIASPDYTAKLTQNRTMAAALAAADYAKCIPGGERMFHATVGVLSEAGELAELLQLAACPLPHEDAPTRTEWIEAWGDMNWYNAIGADAMGAALDTVIWPGNIRKLVTRYPDKFDDEAASGERDYAAERASMFADAGAIESPREWAVLPLDEATTSGMRLTQKAWQVIDGVPVSAVRDFHRAMQNLAKYIPEGGVVPGVVLSNLDIDDDVPDDAVLHLTDDAVIARLP